jgi:SAM-dependent methyltransferase
MNHADHVNLIRDGVPRGGGVWADLGSGTGAFTLALAELLDGPGLIYSVDKDRGALEQQARVMRERFPESRVHYLAADFTRPLQLPPREGPAPRAGPPTPLPPFEAGQGAEAQGMDATHALDGIVAANSLHFQRDKEKVVQLLRSSLKPGGRFILVEYNIDSGNFAVPHPISFAGWQALAQRCGFTETHLLATRPSRFLKEIYSAVSY